MSSKVTFGKWGKSIAVRIPELIAEQLNIQPGDKGQIWFKDEFIGIKVQKTTDQSFDEWLDQELSTLTTEIDRLLT